MNEVIRRLSELWARHRFLHGRDARRGKQTVGQPRVTGERGEEAGGCEEPGASCAESPVPASARRTFPHGPSAAAVRRGCGRDSGCPPSIHPSAARALVLRRCCRQLPPSLPAPPCLSCLPCPAYPRPGPARPGCLLLLALLSHSLPTTAPAVSAPSQLFRTAPDCPSTFLTLPRYSSTVSQYNRRTSQHYPNVPGQSQPVPALL